MQFYCAGAREIERFPMKYTHYFLICFLVVVLDHAVKLLIHFNLPVGGDIVVFDDWFHLHYLQNAGMAFGMQFEFEYGKLFLSVFRIFATIGIGYYLYTQAKKQVHKGFLICLALILGGAVGNAVDSIFYGVLLEGNAIIGAPTPWFHGQVIDMLYFPLFEGSFPTWFPVVGGKHFQFFNAIFNVADSSIFIGAVSILIFQKRFFPKVAEKKDETNDQTEEEPKLGNNEGLASNVE